MYKITSTAPGRICLFGDHQDYLKLPIIACAINRYIKLDAIENGNDFFEIYLPDLNDKLNLPLIIDKYDIVKNDFLRSGLKVVYDLGIKPNKGFSVTINSKIPINGGLSSSSAFTIVWINFLISAYAPDYDLDSSRLVNLAYNAEVKEHNSSGGKMDHNTIVFGNTIYLDTKSNKVFPLKKIGLELVVGVSGQKKKYFKYYITYKG